jgi:hypothetical protein
MQIRTWLCGLASRCSHSAREICHWKGGGRQRWHNVEAEVTSCVVRSVKKCGFVSGTNKEKRTKIHLSFIYETAIAIHYSLPSCLIRFPYGHACIPFYSPRCLCITHGARHLQYKRAIVVCYVTDDSWCKRHLLDHVCNAVAMTLGPAAMLCPGFCTGSWQKRSERSKRVKYCGSIHTLQTPLEERGRRVQSSVAIGSEMWICIRYKKDGNKQTETNKKPFHLYIYD